MPNPALLPAANAVLPAKIGCPSISYRPQSPSHHTPEVPSDLKWLVGHFASRTAGCQYCALHTISNGAKTGGDAARIEAVWEYETSPLFSDAKRAALSVAQLAAQVPNMVDDETFVELCRHWSVTQCAEIMAVVALFGFLNRWADTIKTELEDIPLTYAEEHRLAEHGWDGSEHQTRAAAE